MAGKKITDMVEEILSDFLKQEGYVLYSSEFIKEGRDWFLRVYIDFEGYGTPEEGREQVYIGTEDCEKVSRFLSEKLDEADPVEQNYYLEVSSPGMDRALTRREHFTSYIGSHVEIRLYRGIDGIKNFEGVLTSYLPDEKTESEDEVTVKTEDREWVLRRKDIAKVRLAVIF